MELWSANALIGAPSDRGQQLDEVMLAVEDAAELRSLAALLLEAAAQLDVLEDDARPYWHLHYRDSDDWRDDSPAALIVTCVRPE